MAKTYYYNYQPTSISGFTYESGQTTAQYTRDGAISQMLNLVVNIPYDGKYDLFFRQSYYYDGTIGTLRNVIIVTSGSTIDTNPGTPPSKLTQQGLSNYMYADLTAGTYTLAEIPHLVFVTDEAGSSLAGHLFDSSIDFVTVKTSYLEEYSTDTPWLTDNDWTITKLGVLLNCQYKSFLTISNPSSTLGTFSGYTKNISTLAAISSATFKITPDGYYDSISLSYKALPNEILSQVCVDYELTGTTNSNGYVTFAYGVFGGNLRYKVTASKSLTTFYSDTSKMMQFAIYKPTTNGTVTMYGVTKSASDTTNIYLFLCEDGEAVGKKNGGYPVPITEMIPSKYSQDVAFNVKARNASGQYSVNLLTKSTGATPNLNTTATIEGYSTTLVAGTYNTGSGLASASILKATISQDIVPTNIMFKVTDFVNHVTHPNGVTQNAYGLKDKEPYIYLVSSASTGGVVTKNYAYCFYVGRNTYYEAKIATFQDLADMYSCYNIIKDNSTDFATYVTNNRSNLVTAFKNKLSSTSKVQSTTGNSVQQCYYDGSSIINLNTIYSETTNPKIKPASDGNYLSVKWHDAFLDTNAASTTYPIITYYSCTPSYTSAKIVFTIEEGSAGQTDEIFITNSNSALWEYYSLSDLGSEGGRYYINQQVTPGTTYSGTYLTASNSAGSSSSTTFTFKAKSYPTLDTFSQTASSTTTASFGIILVAHEDNIQIDLMYVYVSSDNGATWTAKTTTSAGDYWEIGSNEGDGMELTVTGLTAGTTYLARIPMDLYLNGVHTYYTMQLGTIMTAAAVVAPTFDFAILNDGSGDEFEVANIVPIAITAGTYNIASYGYKWMDNYTSWTTVTLGTGLNVASIYSDDDHVQETNIYIGDGGDFYAKIWATCKNGVTYESSSKLYIFACCFLPGTQVMIDLEGNTMNIEDIHSGDTVVSYNKETGEYYITEVVKLITKTNVTNFAKVTLENGSTVTMNAYHPILTTDGWHSLTNYKGYTTLQEGDVVITKDGTSPIVSIERWTEEPTTMYNLDVHDIGENPDEDNNDNFIANGMVVHNGC